MKKTILLLMLAMLLASCTKAVYVPVETVRTDTLYRGAARVDSVVSSDTVRVMNRGDTVFSEVIRWRTMVRERHDTVYDSRVDSVAVPYPVEVVRKVERELTAWERVRLRSWWAFLVAAVAMSAYVFRQPLISFVRKLIR